MRFASISDRLAGLGAAKWEVHYEGQQRARAGQPVIMLSIGEPDLPPPARVLDRVVQSMYAGRTRYAHGQGEPVAREAVARHLAERSGMPVSPEQVLYCAGTQNGLYTCLMTVVESGDEVIVPDPYYATYEGLVAASGATFVAVQTSPETGFHLTAEALEAAITPRTRVLLLNTPSNPTGAVLSEAEVDAIGAVCERHDLWILSDEVYADIMFSGRFCSPFDRPQLRERTMAVSSISKSHLLPGFRAGWVAAPESAMPRLLSVAEAMLFGSQPFLEDALAEALTGHHPEVQAFRDSLLGRAEAVVGAFEGCIHTNVRMPEGGMFLMVDVRATGLNGEQFAWRLLDEANVVVMPGESFGLGAAAGHVRVALTVEKEQLREACVRIRQLIEKLAG
jgi:arginine:pyruvate transaminase